MVKAILIQKKYKIIWCILLGIIIFLYYFSNLKNIFVIWELPDEAGYLYNAAYLAGKDWNSYANLGNAYYGYGYSILLIPVFYFCKSGVNLIKIAILINYLLILCIYWIQIYIFMKLFPKINVYMSAIVSFITLLFPYFIVSSNKVICEVFLSFQVWLLALTLCKLIDNKKRIYYLILGIEMAFIYYTHSRAIAVVGVIFILVALYLLINHDKKGIGIFLTSCFIMFAIGNSVEKEIIGSIQRYQNLNNEIVQNQLNKQFLLNRLSWLFSGKNLKQYLYSACCRLLYVVTASTLNIIWAMKYIVNRCISKIREITQWETSQWLLCFFGGVFFVMFLLCVLSGAGIKEDFTYTFYGRYIEYALFPLIGIGILVYFSNSVKIDYWVFLAIIILGIASAQYINFLESPNVRTDTARIAGFSFWIIHNQEFVPFVYSLCLILEAIFLSMYILKRIGNKIQIVALIIIVSIFLLNDRECKNIINSVNRNKSKEIEIAEYIEDNISDETVYFVNKEYDYKWDCIRMQVFLMNTPIIILNDDLSGLNDHSYIIAYTETVASEELSKTCLKLMETDAYCLFKKE